MKKVFSVFLAILMVVTMLPMSAFAEDDILNYITYEINDGEVTITYCDTSISGDITIPDTIEGYPVTTIGDYAFSSCDSLANVTIGNSVTTIGDYAFSHCDSLASVTIGNSVTTIGGWAFYDCSSLANVTIGNSVTTIGDAAFYTCESLASIDIPDSVTTIGDAAFAYCDSLASVAIGNSVTTIGDETFYFCDSLASVTIGNSVTTIGSYAFYFCDSLANIDIPDSVTTIGTYAFCYCDSLASIEIPDGVTTIGDSAFRGCDSLESIDIPDSVTTIGNFAFRYCDSLTDVYYGGSQEDWIEIFIGLYNECLTNATIHFSSGGKLNTNKVSSSKVSSSGNNIVITPDVVSVKDEIDNDDLGVKCTIGSVITENDKENRDFIISSKNVAEKVTLSKAEFQNYIIPADVIESWQHIEIEETQDNIPSYKHTAVLRKDYKDGKPYVSTVFVGKGVNEYVNVMQSEVKVFKNSSYDIIISADNLKGSGYTYYIEQDAKYKISSSTGVFSSLDLYSEIDFQKDCYAYVKSPDGVISELEKIKLSKQPADSFDENADFLKGTTFNLLGKEFLGFTIPSDVPLIGDAKISLEAFKLPAGFEYQDNTLKISIGANIFNYGTEIKKNSETKYKKWSAECFKDWKNLCDETPYSADKKKRDEYKKVKEKFEDTWYGKKGKAVKTKDFDIDALGYIEASFVNGDFVIKEASLSISGSYTFKYTQQGAIWVIPAYIYAEAGGSLGGAATGSRVVPDSELPFKWKWTITFEPSLKVGAGAGVKDVAAAGVWAKATMPLVMNLTKEHFKWDMTGEIGIEAQFFILKAEKPIFDGTLNLVDHYWGDSTKSIPDKKYMSANAPQVTTSVIDRDYLENTSPWLGGVSTWGRRSVAQNGLSLTQLQTSVLGQASPQVVAFGDKMLMTWVEDDASRDTYNRMRLMYSIYENGTWSQPVAVDDDGRNDATPVIATDGKDVYFAWQKIDDIITEETAKIDHLVKNTEIFTAKYDASKGKIVDVKNVSDNSCYDYAQSISIVNGKAVCYWASCKDNSMNISTDNSIYRFEAGSEPEEVRSGLNYILALAGASVDGSEHISYSMDADSDTTTTDDITVYTLADGKVTAFDKGENNVAYTSLFYGELDGRQTLFTSDMRNIYYVQDGETKSVIEKSSAPDGNFNYVVKDGVPTLFWTENQETGNAVISSSYEDGTWTNPVQVSDTETQLSSVDIVVYNDEFRGVCTSGVIEYDEEKQTNKCVQTDLCSLKIDEVQDISVDGIFIDEQDIRIGEETEFSVYVTNNGTKAVENISFEISDTLGYCTNVEKEVNLASGEGTFVKLTYTAPENYSKTTLSVTATCNEINDSDYKNDTAEKEIGIANLVITESEVIEIDGQYMFTAMVTNESDVTAENVKIFTSFNDSEEVAKSIVIEEIGPRETYSIQNTILLEDIVFDENDVSRLYISVDDTDKNISGNRICYVIGKPEELECGHILTEVKDDYEPTCTTPGSTGVTECTLCGEIITEASEIPATGHDYVAIVTSPTCTEGGFTTYTCGCGDTYVADETDALGHDWSTSRECSRCGELTDEPFVYDATVRFSNVTARPGETVDVYVSLDEPTDVKMMVISDFVYDTEKLTLINGEWIPKGAILSDWNLSEQTGVITFTNNTPLEGNFFRLTFEVKEEIEDSDVQISCEFIIRTESGYDNETNLLCEVIPGCITIRNYLCGDVNGDGHVDSNDAIHLLYYTLLPDRYEVNQNCDFDKNNSVDSNDAIYLLYHTLLPDRYPI